MKSIALIELAKERNWSERRLLELALSFIARSGLGEKFDAYLYRAAANECSRPPV